MAMVKCKGCKDDKVPEHDTLEGYCMPCAAQRIRWAETLRCRIEQLEYDEICEDCSAKTGLPDGSIGCKAKERIKEIETENQKLRELKCPPISDGDTYICPIKALEADLKIKQSVCETIKKEVTEINKKLKERNKNLEATMQRCIDAMKGSNCLELQWLTKALKGVDAR